MAVTNMEAKTHQPCADCGSSDAKAYYTTGHAHCFACGKHSYPEEAQRDWTQQYLPLRGLTVPTLSFYSARTSVDEHGKPQNIIFQYSQGMKIRRLHDKGMWTEGEMRGGNLFGIDRFPAASAKAITIFEGEFDAMAGYQMLGSKYPAVSVRSSSSARRDCTDHYDYLNSFEKIYICFDNDAPGQEATKAVASLFDFNKVFHVKLDKYKDANEFLINNAQADFTRMWWNAQRFLPDEIISGFGDIDDLIDNDVVTEGVSYPWPRLQSMTYGMRPGEFVLVTAFEGKGKTELVRAIEHHVLKTTKPEDVNVGIIHLEEGKVRAIKGLAGLELRQPVHLPDNLTSKQEIKDAFKRVAGADNRVHFYSHFGSDDPSVIMGMVQFLAGPCGCRFIFLDHISMVVSGLDTEDERKSLDWISTRLKMIAESHGVTIVCVSHVNDDGKTRGSRNISKVADTHIHLDRDLEAVDERVRNTTKLTVRKNRFGAKTGPAGSLVFDLETFTLTPEEDALQHPF